LDAEAGSPAETATSAGSRLDAEAGSPAEPATSAGVGAPSGRARANGRVRDVPNERLVRWYVTVGLVDPPLSRRGRVARYGRRHLLQLVAVKRRQAEGRSLAEIQAELAGATDETLAAVARLTDASPAPQAAPAAPGAPDRFWARQPREPRPAAPDADRPDQAGPAAAGPAGHTPAVAAGRVSQARAVAAARPDRTGSVAAARGGASAHAPAQGGGMDRGAGGGTDRGAAGPPAGLVYGIRLAPGVTLLLEGADREPSPDELNDIVDAAEPLLRELGSRRLRAFGPGHPADAAGQSPGAGQLAEGARHDH
jgi:DNA-binding transcriptional MerR regulator